MLDAPDPPARPWRNVDRDAGRSDLGILCAHCTGGERGPAGLLASPAEPGRAAGVDLYVPMRGSCRQPTVSLARKRLDLSG